MDLTFGPASSSSNSSSSKNMSMPDVNMPQRTLSFSEWLCANGYTDGSSNNSSSVDSVAPCANSPPQPPQIHDQHQWVQFQSQAILYRQQYTLMTAEKIALNYLRSAMQRLERDPQKFKMITKRFKPIFKDYVNNNVYVLRSAMEEIFKKSLLKEHFRLSGVKLYKLLYVLNPRPDSLFQTLLKCKLDYQQRELDLYMSGCQQATARVILYLLTELYKQLRTEGSRISMIAKYIVYTFQQLLIWRKGRTETVMCYIYQSLKQVGGDLTADCPYLMRNFMAELDGINDELLCANGCTEDSSDNSSSVDSVAPCANSPPQPPQIYNRQQPQWVQFQVQAILYQKYYALMSEEKIKLKYLRSTMKRLARHPRKYKAIARQFKAIFKNDVNNNVYFLQSAMDEIFKESILKEHFRLSGVKLYKLLYVLNRSPDSLFQTLLKCKLDYQQRELDLYMSGCQQATARVILYLLTELYKQLRTEGSRISMIAKYIIYTFQQLLIWHKGRTEADMRCIHQSLKQVGDDLTADCPDIMRNFMAELDDINETARGKFFFLEEVIGLYQIHWSRNSYTE